MSNGASNKNKTPAWAGKEMRLDPFHLPMQFGYNTKMGSTNVSVCQNGVVMRRTLPCGLPLSIALPLKAFEGVAARISQTDSGDISVSLELYHQDEDMCVPLLVSEGLEEAACDWHSWCVTTGLPMVMIDIDGTVKPVENLVGILATDEPKMRRRSMTLRRRRPRIFMKRKNGSPHMRLRIHGREIIARNEWL